MRKKRLIEEMNNVINKNNLLFSKIEELERALNEKNQANAELVSANARIIAENELLKAELITVKVTVDNVDCDKTSVETDQITANLSEAVTIAQSETSCVNNEAIEETSIMHDNVIEELKPTFATTALIAESKIDAASQSIGRVVLKCAELCNTFASVGDINSKDLINLALGRTEVFKSEVLQLATECNDIDVVNTELASKEATVFEYFNLLSNQL